MYITMSGKQNAVALGHHQIDRLPGQEHVHCFVHHQAEELSLLVPIASLLWASSVRLVRPFSSGYEASSCL